jgi:hypothetical protein
VIRMRVYAPAAVDFAEADRIFFTLVKPVHERHGAQFMGRYRDAEGRHVVLWAYADTDEMDRIQEAVARDPETVGNREARRKHGLHGVAFDEYVLESTIPKEIRSS